MGNTTALFSTGQAAIHLLDDYTSHHVLDVSSDTGSRSPFISVGSKRLTMLPSRSMRNFVKFHYDMLSIYP
ncbi:MAG: hypothetical protein IJV90_03370 [Candidatus Methanomethylophilaceae archaeon]|nr:hypothetical protein [Candidatus Methanomethylophilaceae archaeon]